MGTLLGLALAPVVVLMLYFYRKDKIEPEPRRKVLKVLFLGVLSVIPAIILEVSSGEQQADKGWPLAIYTFLIVAASEELCKFTAVLLGIYNDPEFDEPIDGIVYCVAASLGFAGLENVCYVLGEGAGIGVLRALLSVPGHALFGVAMGYSVGMSRFAPTAAGRVAWVARGLVTAIAMHGLYDFCCFHENVLVKLAVIPLIAVYWWYALRLVRRLQR